MALFNSFFKKQENNNSNIAAENKINKMNAVKLSNNDIYDLTTFPYDFTEDFNVPLSSAQKVYIKKEIFKWYGIYFKIHSVDIIQQFKNQLADDVCLTYNKTNDEEYKLLISTVVTKHIEECLENLFKDYTDEELINWKPVLHNKLWHPKQEEYSNFIGKSVDLIEFYVKQDIDLQKEDLEELNRINEDYSLNDEQKINERIFLIKTYIDFYKEEIMKNAIERLLMEYYNYTKYQRVKENFDNKIYIEYHTAFDCNNYNVLFKSIHKQLKEYFKTHTNEDLIMWFKDNNEEILGFILDYVSNLSLAEQKKLTYKDLSKYALSIDCFVIAMFKINLGDLTDITE